VQSLKSLKSTKSTLFSRKMDTKMDTKAALKMWAPPTLCFGVHLGVYSSIKPGFSHTIPQGTLNGLSAGNGCRGQVRSSALSQVESSFDSRKLEGWNESQ
jgi:hypothetical protein